MLAEMDTNNADVTTAPVNPWLRDWLEEFNGPDAVQEACRFLDVDRHFRNADTHWERENNRRNHIERPGYDVVLTKAREIVKAAGL
jgi:hypothetical protein